MTTALSAGYATQVIKWMNLLQKDDANPALQRHRLCRHVAGSPGPAHDYLLTRLQPQEEGVPSQLAMPPSPAGLAVLLSCDSC